MRAAIPFHRTLQKRQRCLVIPPICGKDLKHFSFVINCVPKIMSFIIDPDENLVQATTPARIRMVLDSALSDLRCEQWAETVPPESYRLMADVDAPFMKKVFNIAER